MRMSCNGCRVLRKGCNEKCSIKPCLQWIKSPDSQSHATLFLAKFYGRAGLLNLVNAAPPHLRPATFRSLLYESCGRMVNPIYGSVGLLWSGQWHLCQEAVDSVLKGLPITPISSEDASNVPPIKGAYDIRHVTKDENSHTIDPTRNNKTKNRTCFKRSGGIVKPKAAKLSPSTARAVALAMMNDLNESSTSHDSSVSHPNDATVDTNSNSCTVSVDDGLELELTLGFGL